MKKYTVNGCFISTEEDSFENGCIGNGGDDHLPFYAFSDTIEGVIEQCAKMHGFKVGDEERNVCDEPGRIEWSKMQTEQGYDPMPDEVEDWKAGKARLWYATFTFYIVATEPVEV